MSTAGREDAVPAKARSFFAAGLRLHAFLIVGLSICIAAGWIELNRARGGHEVAWVYTIEWPIFGVYGTYIWWRLYRDRRATTPAGRQPDPTGTEGAGSTAAPPRSSADDPELAAWQEYLTRLHAVDPPGKPPGRAS